MYLFSYHKKKRGLSYGLINVHQFMLKDIICYYEKGKSTKNKIREIKKNIKQAIKFAGKKKIYPSVKTNRSVELFEEMYEELETTHKVLKEAAVEMENMLNELKQERVINVHSLVIEAQEYFKEKQFKAGIRLLTKAQKELDEKRLLNTRKKILAGYDSEIKKMKNEIESRDESLKARKKTKFFSMTIPWEDYTSYKLVRSFFNRFNDLTYG